jgi:hypothetical protein
MWPQTVEYCSIWKPIGEIAFWFLAVSNMVVFVLGLVLISVQCHSGLCTKKADTSAKYLLSLGPLSLITSSCFIGLAFTQLFLPHMNYAIIFHGIASGLFWVLAVAYVQTYLQFLAKQTRMNDDLKKRFFSKYARVISLYMPLHILCVLFCACVSVIPASASILAWDIGRALCVVGSFVPLCMIGLYILPSSMYFSIREIEIGSQIRHISVKQRASRVEEAGESSYAAKNTAKIQSLLYKMKLARLAILSTAASQFLLVLLVHSIPGFRYTGGVQNAISFGCVACLITMQYLVLLNHLGHSISNRGCCRGRSRRATSTVLASKKSIHEPSGEKSGAASTVRPISTS